MCKLLIIINKKGEMDKILENPHPGTILKEEFLDELGLSMTKLAGAINVPKNRIHHIVKGTRGISADTDLRLSRFFGLSEGYWLRLQNQYDLLEAKRGELELSRIEPYQFEENTIQDKALGL